MMNADDIEAYVEEAREFVGTTNGIYFMEQVFRAAEIYASLLRRIETGEMREQIAIILCVRYGGSIVGLAKATKWEDLLPSSRASYFAVADRIIALFREGTTEPNQALRHLDSVADGSTESGKPKGDD